MGQVAAKIIVVVLLFGMRSAIHGLRAHAHVATRRSTIKCRTSLVRSESGSHMYTNQDAAPQATRAAQACTHASGEATPETCAYLRLLRDVLAWTARAEATHRAGVSAHAQLGELWVLQARLSYALDHCPNTEAPLHTAPVAADVPRGYAR